MECNEWEKYEYTKVVGPFSYDFRKSLMAGNTDFHMHSCHEIYYLLDGKINYFVEQSCYPMESGDLILFSNQEIHKAINLTEQPFERNAIHENPCILGVSVHQIQICWDVLGEKR